MLIDCSSFLESVVANLCSHTHQRKFEHSLPVNFLLFIFPDLFFLFISQENKLQAIVKFFVISEWLEFGSCLESLFVHFLFLSLNLVMKRCLCEELSSSPVAIDCIKGLNQKSEEQVHLILILDD